MLPEHSLLGLADGQEFRRQRMSCHMTGQLRDALIVGAQQRNRPLLAGGVAGCPSRLGAPILSVDRHDGATCAQDHCVQGVADVEGRPMLGVGLLPAVAERAAP